jgi:glycosyltransferase involved in cell wall biosynthesis
LQAENLAQQGKFQESHDLFKSILSSDPVNLRCLMGLGVVCFKMSHRQESIDYFKKVISIKNNHIDALKNLAMVLADDEQPVECQKIINELVAFKKQDVETLAFSAQILGQIGNTVQALENIEKALEHANISQKKKYIDIKASILNLPAPSKVKKRQNIALCCAPGMDSFVHDLVKQITPYANINPVISTKGEDHIRAIMNSEVVWLEWGNQLTQFLLNQKNILQNKQIIVRIHSYEVLDNLVDKIDFSAATDIIFVSPFLKNLFLQKKIQSAQNCKMNVIHNGIDTRRFCYVTRSNSKRNIAFLAHISYKKDPMLMLHAFSYLCKRYPEVQLHVAGMFQDKRYELGMPHFLKESGLTDKVTFYGHINNADEWLKDKDFIFCTSAFESQGVGILEAMSRGCRPLIYNFPGADALYLPNQLWTTFDDLEERFLNGPDPKDVSDFVAKYYSRIREVSSWLKVILNKEHVEEVFDFSSE